MTTIRYRIEDCVNGHWRDLDALPMGGAVDMDVAESYYDSLRNQHKDVQFRLIQIEERQVRYGKGRVYE